MTYFSDSFLERGFPEDAVSASLITLLTKDTQFSSPNNIVVIAGLNHLSGPCDHEVQGVVDDALEAQGASVSHLQIFSSKDELQSINELYIGIEAERVAAHIMPWVSEECKTSADRTDAVYIADSDDLYVGPHEVKESGLWELLPDQAVEMPLLLTLGDFEIPIGKLDLLYPEAEENYESQLNPLSLYPDLMQIETMDSQLNQNDIETQELPTPTTSSYNRLQRPR